MNNNTNANFVLAKKSKKDEFYTQLTDIENELKHYVKHFKDKVVYCNCDDPEYSNFYFFFHEQFNWYGLKKLITTHYEKDSSKQSFKIEITSKNGKLQETKTLLKGDGDFRSDECIELLKESDIVVTNPPFSLFREYVDQLIKYNKKFLIIGNLTAVSYKNIFKFFKEDKIWLGYGFKGCAGYFKQSPDYNNKSYSKKKEGLAKVPVHWYTNLEHSKRNEELILWETYTPEKFPKYCNYDAINVNRYIDIPKNYKGYIGVPTTFLDKYNPNQFEIIALGITGSINFSSERKMEILKEGKPTGKFTINAKGTLYLPYKTNSKKPPAFKDIENGNLYQSVYARIIIRNKQI